MSSNFADYGGGIYIPSGAVITVNQSTISTNSAATGSGIDVAGGSLFLTNSIVAGDTGSLDIAGSFVGTNNLTSGVPLLAPLGNYGGPTQTVPPLPGSPPLTPTNFTFATDQRGCLRPLGTVTDLGAVQIAWPGNNPFGNALFFNGAQYVSISNFGAIIPTNEITVEFWAYTTQLAGQSAFMLSPDEGNNRFNAHINYADGPALGDTYWDFGNINTEGRLGPVPSPANSISNWVHYALVQSQRQLHEPLHQWRSLREQGRDDALCAGRLAWNSAGRGSLIMAFWMNSASGITPCPKRRISGQHEQRTNRRRVRPAPLLSI